METPGVSACRWIILAAIVPIITATEMMWLSLAPISSQAAGFFQVSDMQIALFSMSYMIMYIVFALPASWVIDRFGFRASLTIGALLTAVFGLARAYFIHDFNLVLGCQFLIAIGQPFLLNITTKVPANWFPASERATAAGLLTMAQYVGFALAMALSPMLAERGGIPAVLWVFGWVAVLAAFIAIVFTREKPLVPPPGPVAAKAAFAFGSIKALLLRRPIVLVLIFSFISIGTFNTLLTLLEAILAPRGISSVQAGVVGAVFVVAGVAGAVVLPLISDRLHTRVPMFVGAIALLVPLLVGFTYLRHFLPITLCAGLAGFSTMGVAPVLFQYGSEVAYPIPEGTSLGMILLMGQVSGALFVYLFEVLTRVSGSITTPMLGVIVLTLLELPVALQMKEAKL
jgi:MFS family permease